MKLVIRPGGAGVWYKWYEMFAVTHELALGKRSMDVEVHRTRAVYLRADLIEPPQGVSAEANSNSANITKEFKYVYFTVGGLQKFIYLWRYSEKV